MQREKYCSIFRSMADFFAVLGNSDRIRILALLIDKPRGVNEIHDLLGISQPRASQSLKILKLNHIVTEAKAGKHVYYSIVDEKIADLIKSVFDIKSIELLTDKSEIQTLKELADLWNEKTINEK